MNSSDIYSNLETYEQQHNSYFHHVDNVEKIEFSYNECVAQLLQYLNRNDIIPFVKTIDSIDVNNKEFKEKIISLQNHWMKEKYCLRACFKGYAYYRLQTFDFDRYSSDYIQNIGIYRFLNTINMMNPIVSRQKLADIVEDINIKLNELFHSRCLTQQQYKQMRIDHTKVELNHLLFMYDKASLLIFLDRFFLYCYSYQSSSSFIFI